MGITPPPQRAQQGRGRAGGDYNHHASDMLPQHPIRSNQYNFSNTYYSTNFDEDKRIHVINPGEATSKYRISKERRPQSARATKVKGQGTGNPMANYIIDFLR